MYGVIFILDTFWQGSKQVHFTDLSITVTDQYEVDIILLVSNIFNTNLTYLNGLEMTILKYFGICLQVSRAKWKQRVTKDEPP